MHFRTIGTLLIAVTAFAASAIAQPPAAAPPVVVAAAKLPTVMDAPRFFKVVSVTLPAGAKSSVTGPSGILYQISGSTAVSLGGEAKTVNAGEGIYIAAGTAAQLQAGPGAPSMFLHFFLAEAADLSRPVEKSPASVRELYRATSPIPNLKAGAYDINLTRATFAPQMALTPPHQRSGAALYYIVSGTADNIIEGTTTAQGPGSFIYEPYSLVHQWANPRAEPATRLVFNINPEGVAAVLPGAPSK